MSHELLWYMVRGGRPQGRNAMPCQSCRVHAAVLHANPGAQHNHPLHAAVDMLQALQAHQPLHLPAAWRCCSHTCSACHS